MDSSQRAGNIGPIPHGIMACALAFNVSRNCSIREKPHVTKAQGLVQFDEGQH